MRQPTALEQQQHQRLSELLGIARQGYLAAGGDPRHPPSGLNGEDYLLDEERQEVFALGRQILGTYAVED